MLRVPELCAPQASAAIYRQYGPTAVQWHEGSHPHLQAVALYLLMLTARAPEHQESL